MPNDNPYKNPLPDVNFFIYPPLQPAQVEEAEDLLNLHQPPAPGYLFTIYISIPYCTTRCNSCHMFRALLPRNKDREAFLDSYLDCLIAQAKAYAATAKFAGGKCSAIYLGGGTASLLSQAQLKILLDTLKESFHLPDNIEINLEGNPNEFSAEYLAYAKSLGIRRISIGYQSANDKILTILNSPHRSAAGILALKNATTAGFHTVNIDLLFNVPGQTLEEWKADLLFVLEHKPDNITVGDYMILKGSKTEYLLNNARLPGQLDVNACFEWYLWASDVLNQNGYKEQVRGIFCKEGHQQDYVKFSCNYNQDILGLGAGAYSFIYGYQVKTEPNPETFKNNIRQQKYFTFCSISKKASERNLMERYVVHNLYSSVVSRALFAERYHLDLLQVFPDVVERLVNDNLVEVTPEYLRLTPTGKKWRRNVYYEFYSELKPRDGG